MAVHGVEVSVGEFRALGVGIGNLARHRPGEQVVEGGDVGKSARAFEGFEKMAGFDVGDPLVGMELEELLPDGRGAQSAQHAELTVVDVGYVGAAVLARGLGVELENVREKTCGEFTVRLLRVSHKFFRPNENLDKL